MGLFSVFGKKSSSDAVDLKPGTLAPNFELRDQDGKTISLSGFKNSNHVLLLFVRGVWCPACQMMLRSYLKESEKLKQKNVVILSIGPDPFDAHYDYVKKLGLPFRMLADETQLTAATYGVHIKEDKSKYEEGMPIPSSFLIDKQGVIRFSSRADSSILSSDSIFPVLDSLD